MQDRTEPYISRVRPDERHNIFTEDIDYRKTEKKSIWGKGYEKTLELFKLDPIKGGRWLNLAAGDGRYNNQLLKYGDSVVASDIDAEALSKLQRHTPKKYRDKLTTVAFNLNGDFPLKDGSFNGIFCTGILHLFSRPVLEKISKEMLRILKPGGRLILEFPTEIKRIGRDGSLITFGDEPNYSIADARSYLQELVGSSSTQGIIEEVVEDFPNANPPFTFHSKIILLECFKTTGNEDKDRLIVTSMGKRTQVLT
ncbi:hypothetical protein COV86_01455 [Candidatus Roizmanbacteria bacterium CG11_big_fil_rev_8_21_14_0_20_35_14]|uniref:Methyltransferase type 11 domain-containing protein n=2 Tax=Candidatus Roizmaniibacteriota TaxID=1752723 RepID=A0A2M8EYP5_9BACT|nr:MAG: hypothetical protein COV86_01455 [Candidatus Roizmanbacteria bacterium CG11_big_fil_rev_8_21_14_0_20_35_14]PJC31750.1 MAG: hypothetical protein CO049_03850 [Candidatus Roizmanbacteria bacterium CG_4_9_14_0_2_um_filter_36_12]